MSEGIDRAEYRLLTPALLTRLGRLELIARHAVTGMFQAGMHRSRALGSGQEFEQYRRYTPGDDLRQVDWRLFARSDQLHCRLQTPDTAARVAIVLDASASMGYRGNRAPCSKLRCASILAACIAYLAEKQGDALTVMNYGVAEAPVAAGRSVSFSSACRMLESLTAAGDGHAASCLDAACEYVRGRGIVVWITDFLGEEATLEATLRAFQVAGKACYAFQVMDPDELTLDLGGARRFQDPEGDREITAEPARAREEYLLRLREFQKRVRQACLKQGVPLAQITALDDLGEVLAGVL